MASGSVLLLFTFILSVSTENYFGLDKEIYNKLLAEEYSTGGAKEEIFLKHMWNKIKEIVPPSVITPPLEYENSDEDLYYCITETIISPKLGNINEKKATGTSDKKIQLEIHAELNIENPMIFDNVLINLLQIQNDNGNDKNNDKENDKKNDKQTWPLSKFSFSFKGKNTVKLNLEIPDFSSVHASLSAKCLVTITGLEITEMAKPEMDCQMAAGMNKDLPEHYWAHVSKKEGFFAIISDGLIRGIDERLQKEKEFWVCASDEFKKKIEETYSEGFKYTNNYENYCQGVKVKNA